MKSRMRMSVSLLVALGAGAAFDSVAVGAELAVLTSPAQAASAPALAKEQYGKVVYTQGGNEIGEIADMVRMAGSEHNWAVISLGGGTLDTPPRQVTVPASEISFTNDCAQLTWAATKDLVRSIPVYETDTATRVTE